MRILLNTGNPGEIQQGARLGVISGVTIDSSFFTKIAQVVKHENCTAQLLAFGIRRSLHVAQAAKAGADIVSLSYKVLSQMMQHPLTGVGVARLAGDRSSHGPGIVARRWDRCGI